MQELIVVMMVEVCTNEDVSPLVQLFSILLFLLLSFYNILFKATGLNTKIFCVKILVFILKTSVILVLIKKKIVNNICGFCLVSQTF